MTSLYTINRTASLLGLVGLTVSFVASAATPTQTSIQPTSRKKPAQKTASTKRKKNSLAVYTPSQKTSSPTMVSAVSKSDSAIAVGNSTTGNSPVAQSVAEAQTSNTTPAKLPLSLIDVSIFYGPSVTNISASTADDTVDTITGIWSRHQMLGIYSLGKGWNLLPVFDFNYQFTDPVRGGADRGFQLNDPNIRVQKVGILSGSVGTSKLALDGDVRYFIPVSKNSRTADSFGSGRMSLIPSVIFGKSGFSFVMTNFVRGWAYQRAGRETSSGAVIPHRTFQAYSGSQINYAINDNVQPFILFETSNNWYSDGLPEHADEHNPKRSLSDLEPGVNVQITDRISLTPFLNWYTNQKLKTTSANLTAVIQLF